MFVDRDIRDAIQSPGSVSDIEIGGAFNTGTEQASHVDERQQLHVMLHKLAVEAATGGDPVRATFSYIASGGYLVEDRLRNGDYAFLREIGARPRFIEVSMEQLEQTSKWGELSIEDFLETYFSLMDNVSKRAAQSGLNPFRTETYREPDETERALEYSSWQEMLYRRGYWPGDIEDVELWKSITQHSGNIEQALYNAAAPYDDIEETRANDFYWMHYGQVHTEL